MIVFSQLFSPKKSVGSFKMAAKIPFRGSAAASEIRVYIQDDNHDKEIISCPVTALQINLPYIRPTR